MMTHLSTLYRLGKNKDFPFGGARVEVYWARREIIFSGAKSASRSAKGLSILWMMMMDLIPLWSELHNAYTWRGPALDPQINLPRFSLLDSKQLRSLELKYVSCMVAYSNDNRPNRDN